MPPLPDPQMVGEGGGPFGLDTCKDGPPAKAKVDQRGAPPRQDPSHHGLPTPLPGHDVGLDQEQRHQDVAPQCCSLLLPGRPSNRNATNAIALLEAALQGDQGKVLASLDMQQCFDRTHPRLATDNLRRKGFDYRWAAFTNLVWCRQQKWLQLGKDFLARPESIHSSVPQGCPMAPLPSWRCWLSRPVRSRGTYHLSSNPSLFIDDRAAVCDGPVAALQFVDARQATEEFRRTSQAENRLYRPFGRDMFEEARDI